MNRVGMERSKGLEDTFVFNLNAHSLYKEIM